MSDPFQSEDSDGRGINGLRLIEIFHNAYTAWIILGVSFCLTVIAYFVAQSFVYQRASDRFQFKSSELEKAILDRTKIYEQVLWGGVGLFNSEPQGISRRAFAAYVSTLRINEHWPGIQGIGYAIPIEPGELQAHETRIREEGFPNYAVRPPGIRDHYSAIIYLEPFDWRNQRAFGYDMWSNEMRRNAMVRARDTGTAATSGIITLVQETSEDIQRGFLTYLPVYETAETPPTVDARRKNFKGWIYAAFRAGNLMKGILSAEDPHIEFELFDGVQKTPDTLLFDSNNYFHKEEAHHSPEFSIEKQIEVQGRTWTLYFNTPTDYLNTLAESNQPAYIAVAGAIIHILLFYVIYSMYFTHRRLKSLEQDWRTILEQAPNALIVVDRQGIIVSTNEQAALLFGYNHYELPGHSIEVLVANKHKSRHPQLREGFFTAPRARAMGAGTELRAQKKDGSTFPVEIGLSPLNMPQGQFVVASIVDTSEWKRIQQDLENFNEQLKIKNQEMEQFIYTVSHDLKSPLVTIGGFTNQLVKSLDAKLDDKQKHKLIRIQHNVNHMEGLLGDLLQLSRVIRQDVEKNEYSIIELSHSVTDTLEASIRDSNASIQIETDGIMVYGNERLILQCLQNLIANAIQYRSSDKKLIVTISATPYEDFTDIHIDDNGMGIEHKYHEKIFRIFERLGIGEGTGVGLAIVKTIMEKHGGAVFLHSALNSGSRFTLRFPNKPTKNPPA